MSKSRVTFTCPKCGESKTGIIADDVMERFTMAILAGYAKRRCPDCGHIDVIKSLDDFKVEELADD